MAATIYIQPIGPINTRLVGTASLGISELLSAEVVMLRRLEIPAEAYDPRRRQYNSSVLLKQLLGSLRSGIDPAGKIIGVIDEDIFSPIFTFVFGEAVKNGDVGLISLKRLRQEYYGMPRDAGLLRKRILKSMLHELGHLLGLVHCRNTSCVMWKCTSIRGLDGKAERFCADCRARLDRLGRRARLGAHAPS